MVKTYGTARQLSELCTQMPVAQAMGGYLVEHGFHIAHGQWLPHERIQSSTWRELKAVHNILNSLTDKLANQRIRWFTDNQNVVRIMNKGSRNLLLQQEASATLTSQSHTRVGQ